MAVMVTVASASSCSFPVPAAAIQAGARLHSFSCDVSNSCCAGLEDAEKAIEVKGLEDAEKAIGGSKGRFMKDLVGTCGRADQVSLYNCAVDTIPRLVPAGKEGKARALIQGKGCPHVEVSSGTDGSGLCHLWNCQVSDGTHCLKNMTFQIEGVSTGCCAAIKGSYLPLGIRSDPKKMQAFQRQAQCGVIGACGKEDQKSCVRFAKGSGKAGKPDAELQLPETFDFTLGGAQEMMTSFMTSEVDDGATEDGATEDGATEDGSQIMTGLLGFVAGAVVTGLGVTFLRRRTPTQDVYSEIVA